MFFLLIFRTQIDRQIDLYSHRQHMGLCALLDGITLLGWSRYTYEPFRFSCSLDWTGRSLAHITYNSACVFGVFVLPLIVMIYCYYEVGKRSNQINPDRRDERDKGMAVFLQIQKKEKKIDIHVTKVRYSFISSQFLI